MNRLLERYDLYLFDLWGVLWDSKVHFPPAFSFCRRLLEVGKRIAFVSNCAEYTAPQLLGRLHGAGLPEAEESWLSTSGQAMKRWFQQNGIAQGSSVYVFGSSAVHENVRRAGIMDIELPHSAPELAANRQSDTLVIGGEGDLTWRSLQEIASCVRIGKLRIVLPNPDRIVIAKDNTVSLPPGMVVSVIQAAVPSVEVSPIGKPYPFIFDYALELADFSGERSRVLMVGDSLETDVLGASNAGIDSLLLGQGFHLGQEHHEINAIAENLGATPTWFAAELSPEMDLIELQNGRL